MCQREAVKYSSSEKVCLCRKKHSVTQSLHSKKPTCVSLRACGGTGLGFGRVNPSPPMKNHSAARQEGMHANALFQEYRSCFREAGTVGSDGRGIPVRTLVSRCGKTQVCSENDRGPSEEGDAGATKKDDVPTGAKVPGN